jgi:rhodanese-related sulfurtransferase
VLLDVREDGEWAAGQALGAVHLPLSRVGMSVARFPNQEVLTDCRSGGRSLRAAKQLADAGIDVHNVSVGMTSWESSGLPVVRDDGSLGGLPERRNEEAAWRSSLLRPRCSATAAT